MPSRGKQRRRAAWTIAAGAAVGLLLGASASADGAERAAAKVEVGRTVLTRLDSGRGLLLVPVRYPIELNGRAARLVVSVLDRDGRRLRTFRPHTRVHAGRQRRPERRRAFTFVHAIQLSGAAATRLDGGAEVRVRAIGTLDADQRRPLELFSRDGEAQLLPLRAPGARPRCASVPKMWTRRGKRVGFALPLCSRQVRWRIARRPSHGSARIRAGRLIYHPSAKFRGTDFLRLNDTPVQIVVGSGQRAVVRALGDSVTAGFGYYDDGTAMTIGSLLECRPAEKAFNDACSSNSANRTNEGTKVDYAPDYGLANNVSWAAQWANGHGVANYANYAISGSEPSDWAPNGEFHSTTARIYAEDPDYILLTVGANPLLSDMLFGLDNMGCAISSDILGGYRECVEEAFAEVRLRANLKSLYADLVQNSSATIFVMQYHLSVPSTALAYSATQIAEMGSLLNREIASVAAEVNPRRLQVVAPPHFDVGIDISPVYPSRYSCSVLGYEVDGPSVQSEPAQYELEIDHPLSFCEGPPSGPPWVVSGDTGIHPSAAGYAQMASRVPAPE